MNNDITKSCLRPDSKRKYESGVRPRIQFNDAPQIIHTSDDANRSSMEYAGNNSDSYTKDLFLSRVIVALPNSSQEADDKLAYNNLINDNFRNISEAKTRTRKLYDQPASKPSNNLKDDGLLLENAQNYYDASLKQNLKISLSKDNSLDRQNFLESIDIKPSTIENLKNDEKFLDKLKIQDFNKDTICAVQSIIKANIKHNLKELALDKRKKIDDLTEKRVENPFDMSISRKISTKINNYNDLVVRTKSLDSEDFKKAVEKYGWSEKQS